MISFVEVLNLKLELEMEVANRSKELGKFDYLRGSMGLVSEEGKLNPEYQLALKLYRESFAKLTKVNHYINKNFKKNLKDYYRENRYKQR